MLVTVLLVRKNSTPSFFFTKVKSVSVQVLRIRLSNILIISVFVVFSAFISVPKILILRDEGKRLKNPLKFNVSKRERIHELLQPFQLLPTTTAI